MSRVDDIQEIFTRNGTDKSSHNYAQVYAQIPENITTMLEIGITDSSLRSWTELFPQALIYGVDREVKNFDHPRVKLVVSDINDLNPFYWEKMDLIVDDGSHDHYDQLAGWFKLTDKLCGTYIIEDLSAEQADRLYHLLGRFNPKIVNCREDQNGSRCLIIKK